MPLLHRRPFVPNTLPDNFGPDDEVFYCPLTKEVFTDYEQFFERTILCNSLVWSCSITERGNMTYQEALDHEVSARKKFQKFPKDLQKPMLLLVKLMSRSRIEELNDSIFSFIKKRYFIGEQLEVRVKTNKYEMCRVLDVFPTKHISEAVMNGHVNGGASSDEDDDKPLSKFVKAKHLEPDEVKYQVKISGASLNPIRTVPWTALRRKVRREQCKIFLKRMCVQDPDSHRVYIVRWDAAKSFGLDNVKWEDVFAGPTPVFSSHSPRNRKTIEKTDGKVAEKKAISGAKKEMQKAKLEKARQDMMIQEVKRQEREMKQEMKKKEAEEAKRQKQILMEQRREKIEKMREVKRRLAEYKKAWNKQRDDLECDDLKDMPRPKEIVTRIPPHLFGDVLCILEFFNTFESLFDAKDEFPRGVSLGHLEKALMDENQDGPMCDLLFFFLSNLFRTQSEEEGEKLFIVEREDKDLSLKAKEDLSLDNIVASASLAATWPKKYQGCSLNNLELDSYTVSEILRLYLLTSPARPPSDSRVWRFQQRGGYCINDDTPLKLCLDRPELIDKLSKTSIFNFTPDEKVEILQCLANHLLSFVTPRDFMDDMSEKFWNAILLYREDKRSERKREKDFDIERVKLRNSLLVIKPEKKDKGENGDNADENDPDGDESKKKDSARLMTAEERQEHIKTMEEEEKLAKEAWEFRQQKHLDDIAQFKRFKVLPLGEDRFFRRYWALNCIPGLLVEQYEDAYITEDLLKVRVPQQGQFAWDQRTFSPTRVPNNSTATPTETGTKTLRRDQKVEIGATSPNIGTVNGVSQSPLVRMEKLEDSKAWSSAMNVAVNGSTSTEQHKKSFDAGTQGKAYKWFIYSEEEEIKELLSSLNKRGFRESKLSESLHHTKSKLVSRLKKCPLNELCQVPKEEDVEAKSTASRVAIELSLRDQILDLESRIFEGTLGGIKEEEGVRWVHRVTNAGTYDDELREELVNSVLTNSTGTNKMETEDGDEEEEQQQIQIKEDKMVAAPHVEFLIKPYNQGSGEENSEEMDVDYELQRKKSDERKVKDLALALLQIERGIDRKYLKAPLGYSVDITRRKTRSKGPVDDSEEEIAKRRKESAPYLRRWESSLINCTSTSQVSLHLTTLNKCIIWARSVLNASCRICHRRSDADKMLLCDSCDRGHHMYCLKPALKVVPVGDWFCPQCKPIQSNRISPRKVRTTSYSQEASSEEDEDTEADETEEEEDDEEGEDQEEEAEEEDDEEDESSQEEEDDDDDDDEDEEEPSPPKRGLRYKFPTRPTRTSGRERKPKNTSPPSNTTSRSRGRSAGRSAETSKSSDSGRKGRSSSGRRQATKRNAYEDDGDYQPSTSRRRLTGVWKELNTCQEVLKDLIQHKDSWPFLMPVSKKQVPDYYDIIKNPMDFSTMQNKFKTIEYTDPSEFIADAKLVFSNCLTYNMPRSVHAKAAVQLSGYFEKKMKETGLDRYKDVPPDPPSKKRRS